MRRGFGDIRGQAGEIDFLVAQHQIARADEHAIDLIGEHVSTRRAGNERLASPIEQVIEHGAEQLGAQRIQRRDLLEHGEEGLVVDLDKALDDAARIQIAQEAWACAIYPEHMVECEHRFGIFKCKGAFPETCGSHHEPRDVALAQQLGHQRRSRICAQRRELRRPVTAARRLS